MQFQLGLSIRQARSLSLRLVKAGAIDLKTFTQTWLIGEESLSHNGNFTCFERKQSEDVRYFRFSKHRAERIFAFHDHRQSMNKERC